MRRLVLLTAALLLGTSLPASAKMPPFDMEVETRGDNVEVTVRTIGDQPQIQGFDAPRLDWLLAVLPANQVDEGGRPLLVLGAERTNVTLRWVKPGIYQGSLTLEPGRWAVVPFPDVTGEVRGSVEGWYPNTVFIEVGDETTGIWLLAALVALMAAIAWRARDVVHA